jgi:hypothetical protein
MLSLGARVGHQSLLEKTFAKRKIILRNILINEF